MTKRILTVGHCGPDNRALTGLLKSLLDCDVFTNDSTQQALATMTENEIDLILVNRIFDHCGSCGIDWIRQLKSDPQTQAVPVMLISNFPEAQQASIEAGALPGFGKSGLRDAETAERIQRALQLD